MIRFNKRTIILFINFCSLHLIQSIALSTLLCIIMNIGDKITALRKGKKISQADLAKEAGVSREIIGRYERNEVSPSVDVAKKIADALEVSLDYLAGGSDKAAFDKQTLKLIDEIEELEPSVKDKLIFLANAIIRDAKTGKAYAH
jgi:transcriptional regulator with XRE-family HTH domain